MADDDKHIWTDLGDGTRLYANGELEIVLDDGTYFRNENDYDHGFSYKYPGMKHARVRRGKTDTFLMRSLALMFAFLSGSCAVGLPLYYLLYEPSWWLIGVLFGAAHVGLLWSLFKRKLGGPEGPTMFQYAWNGDL